MVIQVDVGSPASDAVGSTAPLRVPGSFAEQGT